MLLTIHDANLAQVGWIDNDKEDTLNFFNDTWTRYLETGASTFEFSVYKKSVQSDLPFAKSYMALNDRAFVSFVYKGESFVFSLMELEEDEHIIRCVGENLNMELINEHANAYKATHAMTFKQYCEAMDLLSFSFLQIGINEVSDKKLTLEWEGRETKLARLLSLAGRFSAEIDFQTFLNRDGTIKRFVVNVYRENDGENQGVGRVRADLVLEYGDEVQTITRHIDKRDVVNAIRPVGKDGLTIDGMSEWKQYTSDGVLEFHQKGSLLYAPLSMQMYPSAFTSTTTNDNWIRRDIDVDTEDKTVLRAAGIKELRKYAYPATTYKVKGFIDADIGDTLTIKDPGFEPLLLLTARVSEQRISFTNPDNNETEFSNFAALANRLSDGIQAAMERAIEATKRYTIKPATSAGVIFKNGLGESIMTGTLYKGATPIAQDVTWVWFVNGAYRTTGPNFTVRGSEVFDKLRVTMVAHLAGIEVAREDVDFVNVLDGAAGTIGPKGEDGQTLYTWVKYADSPVSGMSDTPTGKTYMGIAYNKTTATESTTYSDYTWSLIKGDKGVQGPAGINGQTLYTWVKYADDDKGAGMSDSPTGKRYLGLAYNKTTASKSLNAAEYSWSPLFDNINGGGRNFFKNSREKTVNTGTDGTYDFRIFIVDDFWKQQDRLKPNYARVSFEISISPALTTDTVADVHFSASPWYNNRILLKAGTTSLQFFDFSMDLSVAAKTYKTDNVFVRFGTSHGFPSNLNVTIKNAMLMLGTNFLGYVRAIEDIEEEVASKADAANTIQRLNELADAQQIAKAELEAKAAASELAAWVQAYRDFVSATGAQQKDAERKFAEISANVNKIVTDYGDSVTRWQYVNGYMDVGDQGLKLGRDDDGTSILIQNNRISMISSGKEVMSISEGVIHIDNGVFTKTLRIGRFREEQYEANPDINVIRYVGP